MDRWTLAGIGGEREERRSGEGKGIYVDSVVN